MQEALASFWDFPSNVLFYILILCVYAYVRGTYRQGVCKHVRKGKEKKVGGGESQTGSPSSDH